jgi:hypothetical protein
VSAPAHQVLEAARRQAGMSLEELWLAYLALGGVARLATVRSYLRGETTDIEYDVLAQALNERFLDQGDDHPVPYHDELD